MNYETILKSIINGNEHSNEFLNQIPVGILIHNVDLKLEFANNTALSILGVKLDIKKDLSIFESIKNPVKDNFSPFPSDLFPPVQCFKFRKEILNVKIGFQLQNKQNYQWVNFSSYPIFENSKNLIGIYSVFFEFEKNQNFSNDEFLEILKKENYKLLQRQFAVDQHAIVAVTDINGTITFVNEKFCKLSKYSEKELLGKNHRIVNSRYHSNFFFQDLYKTIYSGQIWKGEIKNKSKDGNYYWVDTTIVPLMDENGKLDQFISIRTDITKQKQIQENLRVSENHFRVILDSNPQSVVFIDRNKRIQFFNHIANENAKFVYSRELIHEESIYNYVAAEDTGDFDTFFDACIEKGNIIQLEKSIKVNGEDYWFEFQYAPVFNDSNSIVGVLFTTKDINERKILDRKLFLSQLRFRTIFEQAPMGIALTNSITGIPIQVNHKFLEILEYSETEITSELYFNIIHPGDLDFFKENMKRLNEGIIKQFSMEIRFRKKNEEIIWTHLTCVPLWTEGESEKLNIRILIDITHRKKNEEDIIRYLNQLENLNQTKDKFFNIIAHDLRNPFAGILGISELLETKLKDLPSEASEDLNKYARMIQNSSKSAFELLENLMQWAKSQRGEISFNPKLLYLKPALETSISIVSGNAFKKNIVIEVQCDLNERVYADESLLNTILRNLLTNAIKFSYANSKIQVTAIESEEFIEISITDFGVGIEENSIDKIFRIDSKFSKPGTQKEKGTGLGLILCKEFIDMHNGFIQVKSELNKGSTFTISFPKKKDIGTV